MRGVPFISSPWFPSTANRSMYASPSAVSARHGCDSEPKRANRKDVNCCVTHTHTESSSKECREKGKKKTQLTKVELEQKQPQIHRTEHVTRVSTQQLPCLHTSSCTHTHTHTFAVKVGQVVFKGVTECDCWWDPDVRGGRVEGGWQEEGQTKKKRENGAIRVSRSDAVTHLPPHLVTFLSPHAITLSPPRPCHPVTYPLSNWACQPVVMRAGSPLTFCFLSYTLQRKEPRRRRGGRLCPDMPITLDHRPLT